MTYVPRTEYFDRITIHLVSTVESGYEQDDDRVIEISIDSSATWMPGELRQRIEDTIRESDEFGYRISEQTGISNWGASGSGTNLTVQLASAVLDSGIGAALTKML